MSKSAAVELEQLKTAVRYLVGLLEEGSLVKNYDDGTREELAEVLDMLLDKVHGLPENVPENLVQAAVVRSIVGAAERLRKVETEAFLARHMREAAAAASIHGHTLSDWEQVSGKKALSTRLPAVIAAGSSTSASQEPTTCSWTAANGCRRPYHRCQPCHFDQREKSCTLHAEDFSFHSK